MSSPTAAPTSNQPAPPPRRRWLRRLLIALVIVVGLPAVYYWYAHWSLAHDLDQAIAEIDRLDPRWRRRDIEADRKPVRDEDNSALHIIKVARLIGGSGPAGHRDYSVVFEENLSTQAQLNVQQVELLRV